MMGSHFNRVTRMGSQIFGFFGVNKDSKWEDSRLKKIRKLLFIKFNNKLALTAF